MGRRGPVPSQPLAARGSLRARPSSDEPEPGLPDSPPDNLTGEALLEWHRQIAEMEPSGVLTKADRAALTVYCQSWAIMQDAARNMETTGSIIKLPNGYPQQTPYLKVYNEAASRCLRLLAEFGGTPSARARIQLSVANAQDEEYSELEI